MPTVAVSAAKDASKEVLRRVEDAGDADRYTAQKRDAQKGR